MTDKAKCLVWLAKEIVKSERSIAEIRSGMRHHIQSGDNAWRDVTHVDLRKLATRSETLTRMRSDVLAGKLDLAADQMATDCL